MANPKDAPSHLNYEKTHFGGARSDEISAKIHLQDVKYHLQSEKKRHQGAMKNKNDGSLHQKHIAEPEKLIE